MNNVILLPQVLIVNYVTMNDTEYNKPKYWRDSRLCSFSEYTYSVIQIGCLDQFNLPGGEGRKSLTSPKSLLWKTKSQAWTELCM